jgi:hypothetical protein
MGTSEHREKRNLPLAVNIAFSSALSLTAVSLTHLYRWQKEVRRWFVHYSTKTVETVDGAHPVIVARVSSSTKRTRNIEFALRTAEDWRTLRNYIAQDIRSLAPATGQSEQAERKIQDIDPRPDPIHNRVDLPAETPTRVHASA